VDRTDTFTSPGGAQCTSAYPRGAPRISIVVIVRNEAIALPGCLASVAGWADDLVVVDMESTDESVNVAIAHGARVFAHQPLSYADPARNFALGLARGDWILMLDPDERVPRRLKSRLVECTQLPCDVVQIFFRQVMFGREVTSPGASDAHHPRFFRRGVVIWPSHVHGTPDLAGLRVVWLPSDDPTLSIRHETWSDVPSVLEKLSRYVPQEVVRPDIRLGPVFSLKAMFKDSGDEFVRRFVDGYAYLDGMSGLLTAYLFFLYRITIHSQWWYEHGMSSTADQDIQRWGKRIRMPYSVYEYISGGARRGASTGRRQGGAGRKSIEGGMTTPARCQAPKEPVSFSDFSTSEGIWTGTSPLMAPARALELMGQHLQRGNGPMSGPTFTLSQVLVAAVGTVARTLLAERGYERGAKGVMDAMFDSAFVCLVYARRWEIDGRPNTLDGQIRIAGRGMGKLLALSRIMRRMAGGMLP
jgi:glycosyltransferase involved in cell wall biosynthesis